MGFSLKNFLQGAVADINPFDGGKSQGNMNPAPQPASTAQPSRNVASKVFDQLNPFDNSRTFKQAAPQNNQSLWQQGSGFVNQNLVQPVITNPIKAVYRGGEALGAKVTGDNAQSNQYLKQAAQAYHKSLPGGVIDTASILYNNATLPIQNYEINRQTEKARQHLIDSGVPTNIADALSNQQKMQEEDKLLTASGHTLNESPVVGGLKAAANVGQNALNIATLGKAGENLAAPSVSNTVRNIVQGGNYMGLSGALGSAEQGKFSPDDLASAYGQNFGKGAALAGVTALPQLADVTTNLVSNRTPLGEEGFIKNPLASEPVQSKPTYGTNDNEAAVLDDYAKLQLQGGGSSLGNKYVNQVTKDARAIAANEGLDITSGSPADRFGRIADYQEARTNAKLNPPLVTPTTRLVQRATTALKNWNDNLGQEGAIGPGVGQQREELPIVGDQLGRSVNPDSSISSKLTKPLQELPIGKSARSDTSGGVAGSDKRLSLLAEQNKLPGEGNKKGASRSFPDGSKSLAEYQAKNNAKNPKNGEVTIAPVSAGNSDQAILNAQTIKKQVETYGAKALNAIKPLSENDHALLDNLRTTKPEVLAKQAESPEAFLKAAGAAKEYNDFTQAAGSGLLGQHVAYRQNYGAPLLFDRSTPEAVAAIEAVKAKLKRTPGYGKERTIANYSDAPQLKRANENFAGDLTADISRRSNDLNQLTLAKGLREAFPGKVKEGEIGASPDGTYKQLRIAGGGKLSLPAEIADKLNSRAWEPTQNKGLQAYDKVNAGLKYTKLGLGGFHAFTEAGNFIGQQLASGKLFSEPASTAKLFKSLFSEKTVHKEMSNLNKSGTLHAADLAGLTTRPEEILGDVNVKTSGVVGRLTGINAVHDAVFKREIPYAKLKTFEQKTQGLDINNTADVAKMRTIAKSINQVYGGINRAVDGLRPKEFQALSRAVLATDFSEAKIRTLADAVSKGGEAGKLARQTVIGKVLLFGGLAAAGAAVGGEYQGKNTQEILKTIASKSLDPSFELGGYKVGLPKTHVSEFVDALKPQTQVQGAPWNASGLLHYATSRTAALPSEAVQLLANKDYYGQPIYGKDSKKNGGGAIGAAKTLLNLGNTVSPIAAGQGVSTLQGKQNIPAAAANVIGFNTRPNSGNVVSFNGVSTTLSDAQRKEYQGSLNPTLTNWQNQLVNTDAYKNATPNEQSNAKTQLKQDVISAVNSEYASKNKLGQYSDSYKGDQQKLSAKQDRIVQGNPDLSDYFKSSTGSVSKTKSSKALEDFTKSANNFQIVGDTVFRKSKSGAVSATPKVQYDHELKNATLTKQKYAGDLNGYLNTAKSQLDNISSQLSDPTTDPVKQTQLQNEAKVLQKNIDKYTSYGGFAKGKKAKSAKTINAKGFSAPKSVSGTANTTALRSLVKGIKITKRKKVSIA